MFPLPIPGILGTVASEITALATIAGGLVNVGTLLKTAVDAELAGGPAAIVPALEANIDAEVANPELAALLKLILKLGQAAPVPASAAADASAPSA